MQIYLRKSALAGENSASQVPKRNERSHGEHAVPIPCGGLGLQEHKLPMAVISGPQAKYKGEGTINGSGSYGFMLTAIDGQMNGGGGQDKSRIKIC